MCHVTKLPDGHLIQGAVTDCLVDVDALIRGDMRSVTHCAHGHHWAHQYDAKANRVWYGWISTCPDHVTAEHAYDGPCFANFLRNRQVIGFTAATEYTSEFTARRRRDMIFFGSTGLGKSHLASAVRHALKARNYNVQFVTAASLQRIFSECESWNTDYLTKDSSRSEKTKMFSSDLLIVDDLGSERDTKSELFTQSFLAFWDERPAHKSWLITTNLDLSAIKMRYGDKIFSRLSQYAEPVQFSGADYRQHGAA